MSCDLISVHVSGLGVALAASVINFAYLGYFAHLNNTSIRSLPAEGMDLIFITYPAAFATFKYTRLWIFLFFLMLSCVGMNVMFNILGNIELTLIDLRIYRKGQLISGNKAKAMICAVMCGIGLVFSTRSGFIYFSFINSFVLFIPLAFISFMNYYVFCGLIRFARLRH